MVNRKSLCSGDIEPRVVTLRYSGLSETSVRFHWTIDIPNSVMMVSFEPKDTPDAFYVYPNETGAALDTLTPGSHYTVRFLPIYGDKMGDPEFLTFHTQVAKPHLENKNASGTILTFSYNLIGRFDAFEVVIEPGGILDTRQYPSSLEWMFSDLLPGEKYFVTVTAQTGTSHETEGFQATLEPALPKSPSKPSSLTPLLTSL